MAMAVSNVPIKLIVGLGNPSSEYATTRHNAGWWLVERLSQQQHAAFKVESKFKGAIARIQIGAGELHLLLPTTFMNLSGVAVARLAQFYKIPPEAILIAHDELDFAPGVIRFKQGGGHGGHNGLRDVIQRLGSNQFARIRIGIGRPAHSSQVINYVLKSASLNDQIVIDRAIDQALKVLPDFVKGERESAMKALHTLE